MRITVCELPHQPETLQAAWAALREHTVRERSELLLLPEFAGAAPVWLAPRFDAGTWAEAEAAGQRLIERLPELGVSHVVGARAVTRAGKRYNEGFLWSVDTGLRALRSKRHLPDEAGGWEARWFTRGDDDFPAFRAGALSFGLSICTELWALENCTGYAQAAVGAVLTPRATAAATVDKWLALGVVTAARTGAFSISSNRISEDGACGGAGWIIDPDGSLLARTSHHTPFCTREIDLALATEAAATYPRYVFADAL
jgi:N-carbamoylputrescine amidase